jgi:hypothetical protein
MDNAQIKTDASVMSSNGDSASHQSDALEISLKRSSDSGYSSGEPVIVQVDSGSQTCSVLSLSSPRRSTQHVSVPNSPQRSVHTTTPQSPSPSRSTTSARKEAVANESLSHFGLPYLETSEHGVFMGQEAEMDHMRRYVPNPAMEEGGFDGESNDDEDTEPSSTVTGGNTGDNSAGYTRQDAIANTSTFGRLIKNTRVRFITNE